jgi:catechol 2,3-dioxygenase-like lactoylglutathione lyase family enzyme
MINGINHVGIAVANLDRQLEFYVGVLGFERWSEGGWTESPRIDGIVGLRDSAARRVTLRAGNLYVEFFEYQAPPPRVAAPRHEANDRGWTHICIDVTDIDAEYERLTRAGMKFNCPPGPAGANSHRATYGHDPEGNIIEILEVLTKESDMSTGHLRQPAR